MIETLSHASGLRLDGLLRRRLGVILLIPLIFRRVVRIFRSSCWLLGIGGHHAEAQHRQRAEEQPGGGWEKVVFHGVTVAVGLAAGIRIHSTNRMYENAPPKAGIMRWHDVPSGIP